jgi:AcrR family transcriptional regulator
VRRDPTTDQRRPRRPGRPPRTSLDTLARAAVELGLDRFTIAAVAERAGVGESTVYSHCGTREGLFAAGAAAVLAQLDTSSDAESWSELVEVVAERTLVLAREHPGLGEYVLRGPYAPSTIEVFESLVGQVRDRVPEAPAHVAWVLASRPVVLGLMYLDAPVLEPMTAWLRQALIRGLEAQVDEGAFPDPPSVSWQSKIRTPPG